MILIGNYAGLAGAGDLSRPGFNILFECTQNILRCASITKPLRPYAIMANLFWFQRLIGFGPSGCSLESVISGLLFTLESSGEESSEDEESLLAPFARAADHGSPGEVPESPLQQHVLPQTRGPPEPSAPATVSIQNLVDTTDCMRIQAEQAAHAHQSVIQVQPMSTQQQGAPLPRGQTARSQVTIEGVAQPETIRILPGPRAATSGTLLADECHAIPTNMFIDVDAELFVGREMELAQLRRMLEKDRLV